jgi:dTDP-4-dehydrorhamnose 3,5-epimerase
VIQRFSDVVLPENTIDGVVFKELKTFSDGRGFFRELVRSTDGFFEEGFGQWSHSLMQKNTVKAWHFHNLQVDWWYVGLGVIHTVLYDNREESRTYRKKIEFLLGEEETSTSAFPAVVRIPTGVLHGCKVLTDTAHLFYITSRTYDPNDEGRFPFNSDLVEHTWGDENKLIVAENDRRVFVPKYERATFRVSTSR